jgi:prepilin-type N-terminal cleavage/methylation domain-containing protein/prepilin-type processing-associated H-X9-DG protein
MRNRKSGFTLVELLVVIGIIAVLISLLLPTLSRAREEARRAQCLSNIRQISQAFFMYTNENKGWFPAPGVFGGGLGSQNQSKMSLNTPSTWYGRDEDWIAWRLKQPDDPLEGAIVPYMNNPNPSVMRCPSDEGNRTQIDAFGGPYVYSYDMNSYLSWGTIYHPQAAGVLATPAEETPDQGWNNIRQVNRWGVAWKIQQVKNSADKIIVYEMDERFLKDGRGQMQSPPVGMAAVNYIGMVAIRHDSKRTEPDDPVIGPNTIDTNPNADRRGNCGFVDGHAEFMSRREAHSDAHYIPKYVGK